MDDWLQHNLKVGWQRAPIEQQQQQQTTYTDIELAVGNIVRRVLKVIREVARGELETHDMMEEDEHDESGSDEDVVDDNDEPSSVKDISATSSQVGSIGERPQIMMQSSMFRLLAADVPEDASETPEKKAYTLKPLIIQEINEEIIADLETVYKGIADQAVDYIHAK